jgi:hypothetical protein
MVEVGTARVTLFLAGGWPGKPDRLRWPAPEPGELEAELRLRLGESSRVAADEESSPPSDGTRSYTVSIDPALGAVTLLRAVIRMLEYPAVGIPAGREIRVDLQMQTATGTEYASGVAHSRTDVPPEASTEPRPARPWWRFW